MTKPHQRGNLPALVLCTLCFFLIGGGVSDARHKQKRMRIVSSTGCQRHVPGHDYNDEDFEVQRLPGYTPVRGAKVTATVVDLILVDGDNVLPPATQTGTTNKQGLLRLTFETTALGSYRTDYTATKRSSKTAKGSAQFAIGDRNNSPCPPLTPG